MLVQTRSFGEVDIEENRVLDFPNGIIGFPDLKRFILLHDSERGENVGIHWLQSVDEPGFAMPVMNPLIVDNTYDPIIEDDILTPLGNLEEDETIVLVTVSVPKDLTKMTVNLRGPFVINATKKKGCQVIVEGEDFSVRFPIYDILQKNKEAAKKAEEEKG